MKNKKVALGIMLACLVLLICLIAWNYLLKDLVYLEPEAPVRYADSHGYLDAVVSENGNVYVRSRYVSEKNPCGVPDVKEYLVQFQFFPFVPSSKLDRFVQIYDGADAKTVTLASNGGVIITQKDEAYLFCGMENYLFPTFLCKDVIAAQLLDNRVYLLSEGGDFGYIDLDSPNNRVTILEGIISFCVTQWDGSIWVLNDKHELWVFAGEDFTVSPVLCYANVCDFDAYSVKYHEKADVYYQIGVLTLDGTAYYYDGMGLPSDNLTSTFKQLPVEQVIDVAVYSGGIIVVDSTRSAIVYGECLFGRWRLDGKIIARNVRTITTGVFSVNFVTYDNRHLFAGYLPSSIGVELDELDQ